MSAIPPHPRLTQAIETHFATHFGEPRGAATWRTRLGELQLRRYEPMPGTLVLATHGGSTLIPDGDGVEAVLTLHADPPDEVMMSACAIMGALIEFAADPHANKQVASFKPAPQVFGGVDFETALLMPPLVFNETLAGFSVEAPTGPRFIQVVWLVPGYDDEAEYITAHGPQSFFHLLQAQRLDPADFKRSAASTMITPEDAAIMAGASGDSDRGYRVQEVRGGVRIQRNRRKIASARPAPQSPAAAAAAAAAMPSKPKPPSRSVAAPLPRTQRPSPSRLRRPAAPNKAPERSKDKDIRFKIDKPRTPATPPPQPVAPPEDPVESKKRRIEDLKARAAEVRARAEARAEGKAPPEPPVTTEQPARSRPEQARSVQAAERRRARRMGASLTGPKPGRR